MANTSAYYSVTCRPLELVSGPLSQGCWTKHLTIESGSLGNPTHNRHTKCDSSSATEGLPGSVVSPNYFYNLLRQFSAFGKLSCRIQSRTGDMARSPFLHIQWPSCPPYHVFVDLGGSSVTPRPSQPPLAWAVLFWVFLAWSGG